MLRLFFLCCGLAQASVNQSSSTEGENTTTEKNVATEKNAEDECRVIFQSPAVVAYRTILAQKKYRPQGSKFFRKLVVDNVWPFLKGWRTGLTVCTPHGITGSIAHIAEGTLLFCCPEGKILERDDATVISYFNAKTGRYGYRLTNKNSEDPEGENVTICKIEVPVRNTNLIRHEDTRQFKQLNVWLYDAVGEVEIGTRAEQVLHEIKFNRQSHGFICPKEFRKMDMFLDTKAYAQQAPVGEYDTTESVVNVMCVLVNRGDKEVLQIPSNARYIKSHRERALRCKTQIDTHKANPNFQTFFGKTATRSRYTRSHQANNGIFAEVNRLEIQIKMCNELITLLGGTPVKHKRVITMQNVLAQK